MAGGAGKINEYNKSLTPEERKENARKAGSAPKHACTLKQLAKIINAAPAQEGAKQGLEKLGLSDEQMTNSALIVAAVFRAAFNGDMKAVEKWERYIDQHDAIDDDTGNGMLADLIDGLKDV